MRRATLRASLFLLLATILTLTIMLGWGKSRFNAPRVAADRANDVVVFVPRGMPLEGLAETLHSAGAIEDRQMFKWGVRLLGVSHQLKAGEYAIPPTMSMRGVMEHLRAGKILLRSVTIPEGLTVAEVIDLLGAADGLVGEIVEIPPEGSLLPETYKYTRGDDRHDVVRRMQASMTETVDFLWQRRKPGLPLKSVDEAIVLASIIEKETAIPEERSTIAGVFVNRLKRGMRLQSDPTVVYALSSGSGSIGRALTFSDLEFESPFNTYRVGGLPPGPITNPGRASIAAALQPAETSAYYFVADGTGGHVFSNSLTEHRQKVRHWRSLKRQRRNGR